MTEPNINPSKRLYRIREGRVVRVQDFPRLGAALEAVGLEED